MPSTPLSEREVAIRKKLRDDFEHYAGKCLHIRTKSGKVVPFELNKAQRYIHEQAEDQRRRTGRVRKIVVKGRQQGVSTYIEGRLYWKVSHRKGVRAFILTHEQEATNNLFEMASRYHENCPDLVRPHAGAANAKELSFDLLDSGYKVGTAGTKGVGRSSTLQYFHGSEVAYWPFAETHAGGVMQAIPDGPDTESWLESTANGRGNYFHTMWVKAQRGESDYEPIFIPWFWQDEYRRKAPDGFARSSDEETLVKLHGLDDEQLAWRRAKIAELDVGSESLGEDGVKSGEERFRQEYPNTPDDAFDAPLVGTYYAERIRQAEADKRLARVPYEPRIKVTTAWDLGIGDSTAIWFVQQFRNEIRVIDYYEASGVGLEHYARVLEGKGYGYGDHILPHDAEVKELGTGQSRVETLKSLGISPRIIPAQSVDDGIQAVRNVLPRCWFDADKCARGIEALRQYRREYDDKLKAFKARPLHDWSSHAADAFRYLAMGLKPAEPEKMAPINYGPSPYV